MFFVIYKCPRENVGILELFVIEICFYFSVDSFTYLTPDCCYTYIPVYLLF